MNDYKQQIIEARNERETEDPKKALDMFLQINKDGMSPNQLLSYLGELGLTYWHLKNFEEARNTFEDLLNQAKASGNKSKQAEALRHLSRPEFNETDPATAVQYATQARQLAYESNREDLAWFDHGVITALISSGSSETEIKEWFEIEAKDLYEVSRFSKDELAKWVWTTGLLVDRARVFNTPSDLYLALMIAEHFNLARRKKQIEKLIEGLNQ